MENNLLVEELDKAGSIDLRKLLLLGCSGISDAFLLKYIEDSQRLAAQPWAVVVAFFKN